MKRTVSLLLALVMGRGRIDRYVTEKLPPVWRTRLRQAGGRQGFFLSFRFFSIFSEIWKQPFSQQSGGRQQSRQQSGGCPKSGGGGVQRIAYTGAQYFRTWRGGGKLLK